jgi:putative hydrolase of the HAD superfamily
MSRPENDSGLRVVLFDVGGVLVQLNGIAPLLEWLSHRVNVEELWRTWLTSPAVRAFETGQTGAGEFATQLIRELDLPLEPQAFLESFAQWPTGLFPGVADLVARIPPRYTRALLSNSNAVHWPRVIGEMGLGEMFEHHFVSHLTGRVKPDRAAFEHVVDSLGCRPGSILFLDDNLVNVESARAVGMHASLANGTAAVEQALVRAGIL